MQHFYESAIFDLELVSIIQYDSYFNAHFIVFSNVQWVFTRSRVALLCANLIKAAFFSDFFKSQLFCLTVLDIGVRNHKHWLNANLNWAWFPFVVSQKSQKISISRLMVNYRRKLAIYSAYFEQLTTFCVNIWVNRL